MVEAEWSEPMRLKRGPWESEKELYDFSAMEPWDKTLL